MTHTHARSPARWVCKRIPLVERSLVRAADALDAHVVFAQHCQCGFHCIAVMPLAWLPWARALAHRRTAKCSVELAIVTAVCSTLYRNVKTSFDVIWWEIDECKSGCGGGGGGEYHEKNHQTLPPGRSNMLYF